MKRCLLLLAWVFPWPVFSQPAIQYAVRLEATVQTTPPAITLHWDAGTGATGFDLYRKLPDQSAWMTHLGSLPANAVSYTDTTVMEGQAYDYKMVKHASGYTGYGYIQAGMEIPATEDRGRLILLADSALQAQIPVEIETLKSALVADGWEVVYHAVSANDSVPLVKNLIKADYQADKARTRAVFLLGHIPVPYSGNLNPDGHSNHQGAWPADTYYGDMNGTWTDLYVNNTSAAQSRNHNVPGDGKFDQSYVPSDLELAVGRVDLFDLPAFGKTYAELTAAYISKDIAFRKGEIVAQQRALVDDNFGGFNGEAFASSAWKSFSPLVGIQHVEAADYRTSMDTGSYIWSYGCGGGSYTSANGIGNTSQLANDSLRCVFTLLFGSYFGDYDVKNSFLRAPLAQGTILTNAWSGRPHWYFHRMGLGGTTGESALLTVNEVGDYYYNPYSFLSHLVSINLMGDPTLTQYITLPPGAVTVTTGNDGIALSWYASSGPVLGYYVYRAPSASGPFMRVSGTVVADTFFTDVCIPDSGTWYYLVRALELKQTPSGTFYNLSSGQSASGTFNGSAAVQPSFTAQVSGGTVTFFNATVNATQYLWFFGDGDTSSQANPVHTYQANGYYHVVLQASNDCFTDSSVMDIQIVAAGLAGLPDARIAVRPVPADQYLEVDVKTPSPGPVYWELTGLDGRRVYAGNASCSFRINCSSLPSGMYILSGRGEGFQFRRKVIVGH